MCLIFFQHKYVYTFLELEQVFNDNKGHLQFDVMRLLTTTPTQLNWTVGQTKQDTQKHHLGCKYTFIMFESADFLLVCKNRFFFFFKCWKIVNKIAIKSPKWHLQMAFSVQSKNQIHTFYYNMSKSFQCLALISTTVCLYVYVTAL